VIDRAFGSLGRGVVRFRWVIIAVWVVGTVLSVHVLPSLSSQVNNDNSKFLPASAPSNQAANLAEPLIGRINQAQVTVVVAGNRQLGVADLTRLNRFKSTLARVPTVTQVQFLGVSPNRRAAQLLVASSVSGFDQARIRSFVDDLQAVTARASLPAGFEAHLAGQAATNVANQKQQNKSANLTQLLSILFIVVLLLLIFRAALAPLVTLISPIIVLQLAGSFIGALGSHGLKISSITQIMLIVLILGAGTDYGLFLVFRVREELLAGRGSKEAVAVSVQRVGESITASAATVIVALLSLTLASFGIYHDLGVPLAVGVGVMLLAGLTLLPALLSVLGRAVFWPTRTHAREVREGLWGRMAGRLVQRPAVTLLLGVVVFGALALAAIGYRSGGFGGQTAPPAHSDAALGNAALKANFPQSSENPTNLVLRLRRSAWDDPAALATATHQLEGTGTFSRLAGPLDPNGTSITPAKLRSLHARLGPATAIVRQAQSGAVLTPPAGISRALYDAYLATARYISADGYTVQWEAGLKAGDPGSTPAIDATPRVRADLAAVARHIGAQESGVAGEAPALYDVANISGQDLRHIIPVAVLAIGLVLLLVLRSLVAPIYLIVSVVLSYLASLGLAVLVFEDIGGSQGILFLLPFLMFIFLLALGEDYNILVMTRIREEARGQALRPAVVRAVGATGPTVTSAGLVLAGSFAMIAVGSVGSPDSSQFVAIGFGLAVGILLDTFVVRTVLVPSTVSLLGRWNWWPSTMGRQSAAGSRALRDGESDRVAVGAATSGGRN
jgi:RND superfamily putative drug exporter